MQKECDVPNRQRPAPRSINPNVANQMTLDQTNFADHCSEERSNLASTTTCKLLVLSDLNFRLVESLEFLKIKRSMNSVQKPPKKTCSAQDSCMSRAMQLSTE